MTNLPLAHQRLAATFFDIGVVKFGEFRLKLHEEHPDAPLSPIYLNLRTADNLEQGLLTSSVIASVGRMLYEMAGELSLDYSCVAGVPRAGNLFARAFSEASPGQPVPLLRLEKTEKDGLRRVTRLVGGEYSPGERVLVIDDCITMGESKLEGIQVLERAGLVVNDVLIIVDREGGGDRELEKAGYRLHAMFTLSALLEFYLESGRICQDRYEEVRTYLAANS
ncbi:MAG: hypothetical protein KJI72_02905 [Patescibacteria group bacterium]|nr:hypothetical protein [Patescibacteria group bacterium]